MAAVVEIGKLDRRIRIEQKTLTPDPENGSPVPTWSEYRTCWANIVGVVPSKSERQTGEVRLAGMPLRIRIRYYRGIRPEMRIRVPWGSIPYGDPHIWTDTLIYQIVGGPAEIAGRGQWLEMMCVEWSTQGDAQ